ncbi:toll/interleukin-1 receptor domain-containing protein [Treponema bryantii]|uniref:toll/interleukin-1 receptor domain-containing protein n=1 Tax=Treponema bryantii TaxID=163 RepID=UPI002B303FE4|nr:hypothetical protein TRBR_03410 [Treponema bryantii]
MENKKSFFLSHASEDKKFVREVYNELNENENIDCWFDEAEILPGDNLIDKVFTEGFNTSRYVVLFLSKSFVNKNWPIAELKTVISKQIRLNIKIIIPFLLDISFEELVEKFPFFEPIFCSPAVDSQNVVKLLKSQIKRDNRITNTTKKTTSIISHKVVTEFSTFLKTPAVQEVSRLAETFFVSYHRAPFDLKIDVLQYDKEFYMGICNYGIWGPDQATPYKSIRPCETIEDAYNDALQGIIAFDSAKIPDELMLWVGDDDKIFDGTGMEISQAEAYDRRSKNAKKFEKQEWTITTINGGPWWLISKDFTEKKFSITGPIDDDSSYVERCIKIQDKGIDFRIETVETSKSTKEELIDYFKTQFSLTYVAERELYSLYEND